MNTLSHLGTSLLLFPALLAIHPSLAAAGTPKCPESIRVRHEIVSRGASWKPVSAEREHQLRTAGFSDGPADEKAFLKPDSSSKTKQTRIITWTFGKDGSDTVWLSCSYDGTAATVSQKIDGKVNECRVVYEETSSRAAALKQVICQ
jgi:hypothetical protein